VNIVDGLTSELPKELLDVGISACGFFLALWIHSRIDQRSEEGTYRSILAAVKMEAGENIVVYRESYCKYFDQDGGIILRDFSLIVITQSLANPLFVKHLSRTQIDWLGEYLRVLTMCNNYRRATEALLFISEASERRLWLRSIKGLWREQKDKAEAAIRQVQEID
jgi:hypothetical protein